MSNSKSFLASSRSINTLPPPFCCPSSFCPSSSFSSTSTPRLPYPPVSVRQPAKLPRQNPPNHSLRCRADSAPAPSPTSGKRALEPSWAPSWPRSTAGWRLCTWEAHKELRGHLPGLNNHDGRQHLQKGPCCLLGVRMSGRVFVVWIIDLPKTQFSDILVLYSTFLIELV